MELLIFGVLITLMLIALGGTIVFLLYYIGYFHKMKVAAGPSIISEIKIAYKFHTGSYSSCGPHFTEASELCPGFRCIGVFYDDPKKVDPESCRYIVGVILAEGTKQDRDSSVVDMLEEKDFKFMDFPQVDFSVKTTHPYTISTSVYLGAKKAYPLMNRYIQAEKLCAHPFMEIYDEDIIHYMVPLSKQADFYVEEVKDMLKGDQ